MVMAVSFQRLNKTIFFYPVYSSNALFMVEQRGKRQKDKLTYLADSHQYKKREHSEDKFSAPKTIYFTLLSSLVAFPAICQQFLSAKDTHLASKGKDKDYPALNLRSSG